MKPLLSVIVPVYNTEKYLEKCINSIITQNFKNFELLLINDGSTDRSADICDAYGLKDDRIKVHHKINGGVSSARNLGLDHAKGEYVFFVDSDDFILEHSLNFLEKTGTLLDKEIYMFKTSTLNDTTVTNDHFLETSVKLTNELWRYIFKKEIIDRSYLRFIAIKYGEDFNFIAKYFSVCKTNKFIDEFVYVYRADTPNSAMNRTKNINYVFDHFTMINDLVDFLALSSEEINKEVILESLIRGFKMTLVVIARTFVDEKDRQEIIKKYAAMYTSASKYAKLYKFHPFLLKFWINYYKKRA